jgi:hypothetical protein
MHLRSQRSAVGKIPLEGTLTTLVFHLSERVVGLDRNHNRFYCGVWRIGLIVDFAPPDVALF